MNDQEKLEMNGIINVIKFLEEANNPDFDYSIEVLKRNLKENYTYKVKVGENGEIIKYK